MSEADKTMDILNLQFTGAENELQQIIFTIDGEELGVDVRRVQEIIRYITPVKIPNAPHYVQGMINFRGAVVPVVDLRMMFGLEAINYDAFTVIIVVETGGKTFGLTVDRVSDLVSIPEAKIQATPEFNSKEKTKYLKAMGNLGERLILLLDLDKIVNFNELEEVMGKKKEYENPFLKEVQRGINREEEK